MKNPKHGGARVGSGRPTKNKLGVQIAFRVAEQTVAWLDARAAEKQQNRSEIAREIIDKAAGGTGF